MESLPKTKGISVEVNRLVRRFGSHTVLAGISLHVGAGSTFVLMGPSGSGKSVLLRHIAGLLEPDSGEVLLDGKPANHPATRKSIRSAMVFQSGALFNSMSVYDNLALYHREHRTYGESEIREKVSRVMQVLGIEDAGEKTPAELSGGMKKRVAVARAIIMEPDLILYDEPTSELDPILEATTIELIASVGRETGATSLVVSHSRELAFALQANVGLLMKGKLVFQGTSKDFQNSADAQVRSFLQPEINLENPGFRTQGT